MDNQNNLSQNKQIDTQPKTEVETTPVQPEAPNNTEVKSNPSKARRLFFQILIGCLLSAGSLAVIAVLIGGFSETLGRALGTIAMVAIHTVLSFGFVTKTEAEEEQGIDRSNEIFTNTIFSLVAASFVTSVFAIWQILPSDLTFNLYLFYGVLLFATVHADVLFRIRGFEKNIDTTVAANYGLMTVVVSMLTILIFGRDVAEFGELYFRILAAVAIIDATATMTAIIMHKMYIQKNPTIAKADAQAKAPKKNFWRNPLVLLLLAYLGLQTAVPIIYLIVRAL